MAPGETSTATALERDCVVEARRPSEMTSCADRRTPAAPLHFSPCCHAASWSAVPRGILALVLSALLVLAAAEGLAGQSYTRTIESYAIPDVTLINQDGAKVPLRKILLSEKPVLVDFIYTTCTTICPVLSANFTSFQRRIAPDTRKAQLVSISIDPEFDTPKAMKAYLKRYDAKPGWDFLTGSRQDIDKTLRALNAFTLNKMNHIPLILIKLPSEERWIRIFGLVGTKELMGEVGELPR